MLDDCCSWFWSIAESIRFNLKKRPVQKIVGCTVCTSRYIEQSHFECLRTVRQYSFCFGISCFIHLCHRTFGLIWLLTCWSLCRNNHSRGLLIWCQIDHFGLIFIQIHHVFVHEIFAGEWQLISSPLPSLNSNTLCLYDRVACDWVGWDLIREKIELTSLELRSNFFSPDTIYVSQITYSELISIYFVYLILIIFDFHTCDV